MAQLDLNVDEILESLSEELRTMDPSDPEYGKRLAQFESLLRQRNQHFKDESEAVKFDETLRLEKEKLKVESDRIEKEDKNAAKRTKVDMVGHVVRAVTGVGSIAIAGYCTLRGYKYEYDDRNPMSIPQKIWGEKPKIKLPW